MTDVVLAAVLLVCLIICAALMPAPRLRRMPRDLLLVTAFLDLDRGNWKLFKRSVDDYLAAYRRLLRVPVPLVTYVDRRLHSKVFRLVTQVRGRMGTYTKVIAIDDAFLRRHLHAFSPVIVDRTAQIIASESYKRLVTHCPECPENSVPKYTLINHAKIDFLMHTINDRSVPVYKFYGWIDFGYFRGDDDLPKGALQVSRLKDSGVTVMTVNDPEPKDGDAFYTVQNAPERFAGGFIAGTSDVLRAYQTAYHANLEELLNMGIVDDDQAIIAHLHYNKRIPSPPLHFHKRGFFGGLKWLAGE